MYKLDWRSHEFSKSSKIKQKNIYLDPHPPSPLSLLPKPIFYLSKALSLNAPLKIHIISTSFKAFLLTPPPHKT